MALVTRLKGSAIFRATPRSVYSGAGSKARM
jgi:hypothetical protein